MRPSLILSMMLLHPDSSNPIQDAFDYYQQVDAYQAVVKSSTGNNPEKADVIRYFYKKPGFVRMEFIAPFNGMVLVYSPLTGQVKVWPLGQGRLPSSDLKPDNPLVQSQTGQQIDRSDLGALYQNVMFLQDHGKTTVIGTESIADQAVLHVTVAAEQGFSVGAVARYQLWLEVTTGFPLKVMSYKADGNLIEVVEMSEYQINPAFPSGFFDQ